MCRANCERDDHVNVMSESALAFATHTRVPARGGASRASRPNHRNSRPFKHTRELIAGGAMQRPAASSLRA